MHEWALAEGVISTAVEEAEREGLVAVERVEVVIGELQRIKKETFEFAIAEVLPEDTIAGAAWFLLPAIGFAAGLLASLSPCATASGSRSRAITRPSGAIASSIARACPPRPKVQSTSTAPGRSRSPSTTSPNMTGVCAASFVGPISANRRRHGAPHQRTSDRSASV